MEPNKGSGQKNIKKLSRQKSKNLKEIFFQ